MGELPGAREAGGRSIKMLQKREYGQNPSSSMSHITITYIRSVYPFPCQIFVEISFRKIAFIPVVS